MEARSRARGSALDARRGSPAATRGSRTASPCSCARSPDTVTRASPTAPATRSTPSLPQIAKDVTRSAARRSTRRPPCVAGEGQVHFTAKLSAAQPWTVTILNSAGTPGGAGQRHRHCGRLDVGCLRCRPIATRGRSRRRARARPPERSARVRRSPCRRRLLRRAEVAPGETATLRLHAHGPRDRHRARSSRRPGRTLSTLLVATKPAGTQTLELHAPPGLLNGQYTLGLSAAAGAKTATAAIPFTIDDILTGLAATGTSLSFTLERARSRSRSRCCKAATVVAVPAVPAARQAPRPSRGTSSLPTAPSSRRALHARAHRRRTSSGRSRAPPTSRSIRQPLRSASSPIARCGSASARRRRFGLRSARRLHACAEEAGDDAVLAKTKPTRYTLTATDAAGNRRRALPAIGRSPGVVGALELAEDRGEKRRALDLPDRARSARTSAA